MTRKIVCLLFMVILPACQQAITPSPRPSPSVLTVQATITLRPLSTLFKDCVEEQVNTGLVVIETPAQAIDPSQADLALRWGLQTNPEGYAAQLGQEELVFIAHPQNPLDQILLDDLIAIYTGKRQEWPESTPAGEIQAWAYPKEEDIQQVFETALDGSSLSGQVAYIAPDPSAMLQAIAEEPGAIGFIPRRWLKPGVKELQIAGMDPPRLRQPVVVLSNSEPVDQEKAWLLCLQEKLSE